MTVKKEENSEIVEGKLSSKGGRDWAIREGVINFRIVTDKTKKFIIDSINNKENDFIFT